MPLAFVGGPQQNRRNGILAIGGGDDLINRIFVRALDYFEQNASFIIARSLVVRVNRERCLKSVHDLHIIECQIPAHLSNA